MDLSTVARYYIDKMLRDVTGMKVLLLDTDTTRIVSTVYSQSDILAQEVYLVQRLDAESNDQLPHLKVTFCHPAIFLDCKGSAHAQDTILFELILRESHAFV